MRKLGVRVCVLVLAGLVSPALAMTIATDGRARVRIVLADGAIPAERTATEELAHYLARVTASEFEIVAEHRAQPTEPAIWVGPTAMAGRLGIDAEALDPEQWRMLVRDGHLVLTGGRPRGTLYAVYRFLEDVVGVRWWNPFEETVPRHATLSVDVDAAGRPAFPYRDFHGVRGPSVYHARNRANGHYSFLTAAHGGNEGYGPPSMVHTFFEYVPPDEYFATRPELFAERDGERDGDRAQLCLSNPDLALLMARKLDGYIRLAEEDAARRGESPPRLFDVSPNDWKRSCECRECSAIDEREGSPTGSLVHLINQLADAIATDHPGVLVDTLAYQHTFFPPQRTSLRDNVVVRLADLYQRDFARSVTHRRNRVVRRAIEGWTERTAHLRIWAYAVTFGFRPHDLPHWNLDVIARDFRFYLERGVEGLFVQQGHPIVADLRDLRLWAVLKLAEDPTRDVEELVLDFTDGYYGAAGPLIREYLGRLARAGQKRPPVLRYPVDFKQYRHLTPGFLREAQALFDRGTEVVRGNTVLERRLRHARVSLDRATLWRWDDELARAPRRDDDGPAIDPTSVADRLRRATHEQIELRLHPGRRAARREQIDEEIRKALERIAD